MSAPRKPRNAPRGLNEMRLLAHKAARAHRATLFLDSGVLCSRRIRKWPLIFKAVEKEGLYEGQKLRSRGKLHKKRHRISLGRNDSMPEPLWIYLMALLYFTRLTTCSAIADAFDSASHDQLTRMLQGTWSGHTLLDLALRVLFAVAGGYLIVDDTVVAKPAARLLGEAAWVWSNKDRKVLFGVSVVLLIWTDGQHRVPLAFRVWHKGGVSKYDLALELLSYARNRLKCKPQFVLFDSWYPSKKLLKRIRDYGWYFVCQLKKTRVFEGRALQSYK